MDFVPKTYIFLSLRKLFIIRLTDFATFEYYIITKKVIEIGGYVEILYSDAKVERICNDGRAALKFFGGDKSLVESLFARMQMLRFVPTLEDIISAGNKMRFHNLHNQGKRRFEGLYAIDVKTIKQPWRIIIQPLDDNKEPLKEHNIDVVAEFVRIIEIEEISKHYE